MERLPDATRLVTFARVARHGSLTSAARSLGVTTSAVSQQMTALEAECGVRLLDREPRGAVLTGAGDVFSAGGDLSSFSQDVPLAHKHYGTTRFLDLFRAIAELGKPSICKANGHVVAGGLGVALACDLIVSSDAATNRVFSAW